MPARPSLLACIALLALSSSCTSREPGRSEAGEAQCANGNDDDFDGRVDCEDPGCAAVCECDPPGSCGGDAGATDAAIAPLDGGPPADARIPSCGEPLDVVFVLDVSTSMNDEAAQLRDGIESVWNAAHALTTDVHFGLVVFVDDALAVGGCSSFVDLATLRSEFDEWRAFCSTNRSPGSDTSNSDCAENSLDALWTAARSCPWRDGATRVLIHVTDDTFAERPAVLSEDIFGGGGVAVEHTYAEVAAELVRLQLRVGAFAAPGAGDFCGAGTSPDVGRGFHSAYSGMPSLPDQTRGRAWDIRQVRDGTLEMSAAINDLLAAEYCTLF